ncbi:metal-dependent hydrolase [Rummeliibacillus suwonensis]|uniref:metal-dependent hydrolase n=1 Tax=Rummeliibacillus suwonensis TaxID=1306154 RepID=UPI0011B4FA41|nr:metal-dependent hydrolase [Rummeliibacillus suwonensis]MBO2535458.1 metal-dependent hydrolase [Rummeliibacillus suwonensis]
MDSGTHLVMGIALGGLAMVDPVVANHAPTTTAVIAGMIVGSQAPDIDTILKLRSNAVYIRHHRGITHSIPAVILWPILITGVLSIIFPGANLLHLWLWTFFAVFLHVFVDIFNAYGTQALRPFSRQWIALGWINTFDPIIFALHIIALLFWAFGANPVPTMFTLYGVIFIYYIIRYLLQKSVKQAVLNTIPDAERIILSPTSRFFQYRVAANSSLYHYVGRAYGRSITIYDKFLIEPLPESPEIKAVMKDPNFKTFVSFSPLYRWEVSEIEDDLIEVRLIDLRYRSNNRYPFVAIAHLTQDYKIVKSFTGWIFSEDKLQKKLVI